MSVELMAEPEPAMPVPFGVQADTGETPPPFTDAEVDRIVPAGVPKPHLGLAEAFDDPADLSQTGWAIVFARGIDPAIRKDMEPLIQLRREQAKSDDLCLVFEGDSGVKAGESAENWGRRVNLNVSAPAGPDNLPCYLLLVGMPDEITFAFQNTLDLHFCVGRLYFDDPAGYGAYAKSVVAYERAQTLKQRRQAGIWMTRNRNDDATLLLSNTLGTNFSNKPLGQGARFAGKEYSTTAFLSDDATGDNLKTLLKSAPPLLFTGSHGLEWKIDEPDVQRKNQGALVTASWVKGVKPLDRSNYFTADDVPADADLTGTMCFLFACFGGACPSNDSYQLTDAGDPKPLAPKPFVASLPQAMLRKGALAVVAHCDRAWSYGFVSGAGQRQDQLIRNPVENLMRGRPVGLCSNTMQEQWGVLAAILSLRTEARRNGTAPVSSTTLANLAIARDDSRNYIVLGDPATRLRVADMQA